ncbi:hypothetical protein AB1Y20_022095 [Prymnesium parvum]|uniref:HAT C-terminal dimerisation domain-containing protein n=1 Tax=Prymnesium parvum TaxID=97485 RepID=A0AB34JHC4_PRYPA
MILLRRLDSDMAMTGKVYKGMFSLTQIFAELEAESVIPKAWIQKLQAVANKRWEYGHSPFHAAGYAFDPEFHGELCEVGLDGEGLEAVKSGLESTVKRVALRLELLERKPEMNAPMDTFIEINADRYRSAVALRVADFFMDYSTYLSGTGPMAEDYVKTNAKRMRGADFWALHLSHLRSASQIAKVVLGQVACASHAERNWKAYGRIKTPERSALSHPRADTRVFLYNVLQQKDKLKDANYRPKVPEWEDFSSDESID